MRDFLYSLKNKRTEIYTRIGELGLELGGKYQDSKTTYLFNVMSYSSVNRKECARFDFPGEDSIVKRLEVLVKEYQVETE